MSSLNTEGIDLMQMRLKSKSIKNDEGEFDDCFEKLFTHESKASALNTIATLPTTMFSFMNKNNLLSNWNEKDKMTHLLYASLIAFYRRKSIIDESIIEDLITKNEKLEYQIEKMKNNYCFHLNKVNIEVPMDISVLQLQKGYENDWKNSFDAINLPMKRYMNQEDLRIGELLKSHSSKNEAFLINYYKWCVEKYDEWCKRDKTWKWCPEDAF